MFSLTDVSVTGDLSSYFPLEDISYARWISPYPHVQMLALWLRLALKLGYTSLEITKNGLVPKFEEVLFEQEIEIPIHRVSQIIEYSFRALSEPLLPFHRTDSYIQLSDIKEVEYRCAEAIVTRSAQVGQQLHQQVHQAEQSKVFDPLLDSQQLMAVENALKHNTTIIAGGPGTGKTFTVGRLLDHYAQSFGQKTDLRLLKVILAAPTGKAAVQLEKSLKRAFKEQIPFGYEIKTLHALVHSGARVDAHILIVDECSMIDLFLFEAFLRLVPQRTKLVLLGDPDQLPPVGAGNPFSTLIHQEKNIIPRVHLKKSHRSDINILGQFAESLREGDSLRFFSLLEVAQDALQWHELDEECVKTSLKRHEKREASTPLLLSPKRYGQYGIEWINRTLKSFFQTTPLMVTRNDWKLGITNGELGLKIDKWVFGKKRPYFKCGEKEIPLSLIPSYDEAFGISIHKSQGSESDTVFIFLPEGSEQFSWKLLYTAITRARKRVELFASKETLLALFSNRKRESLGLESKLQEFVSSCSLKDS